MSFSSSAILRFSLFSNAKLMQSSSENLVLSWASTLYRIEANSKIESVPFILKYVI